METKRAAPRAMADFLIGKFQRLFMVALLPAQLTG